MIVSATESQLYGMSRSDNMACYRVRTGGEAEPPVYGP